MVVEGRLEKSMKTNKGQRLNFLECANTVFLMENCSSIGFFVKNSDILLSDIKGFPKRGEGLTSSEVAYFLLNQQTSSFQEIFS